jgi:hypothetical protein
MGQGGAHNTGEKAARRNRAAARRPSEGTCLRIVGPVGGPQKLQDQLLGGHSSAPLEKQVIQTGALTGYWRYKGFCVNVEVLELTCQVWLLLSAVCCPKRACTGKVYRKLRRPRLQGDLTSRACAACAMALLERDTLFKRLRSKPENKVRLQAAPPPADDLLFRPSPAISCLTCDLQREAASCGLNGLAARLRACCCVARPALA